MTRDRVMRVIVVALTVMVVLGLVLGTVAAPVTD
jgi:hypothetical protein